MTNPNDIRPTEAQKERVQLILLVQQYERLLEAGDERAVKRFLAKYPGVPNYDERGNWIGNVRYENGWTA